MIAIGILTYSLLAALIGSMVYLFARTTLQMVRDIRNGDF